MTDRISRRKEGYRQGGLFFLLLLLMCLYLLFSETASRSVLAGLSLCGKTLLPSLFPILVLCGLLQRSGMVEAIGRKLSPIFRFLFGISGDFAVPMLTGALCGFPAGAAGVALLVGQGRHSKAECRRGLLLASSASPAFLIVGVGEGMLGDKRLGAALYLIQLSAILLVGFLLARVEGTRVTPSRPPSSACLPFATSFRLSLKESVEAMLSICGAVLFFAGMTGILSSLPFLSPTALCLGVAFCELTAGVSFITASLPLPLAFIGVAATVGWSGLSVHAQVSSFCEGLPMRGYLAGKLLTSLLSALLAALLWQIGIL